MLRRCRCLLLLLPLLAACGQDGSSELTGLDARPSLAHLATGDMSAFATSGDFFPLEIGNRWTYERTFTATTILYDDPTPVEEVVHGSRESELIGFETRSGREYMVQEDRIVEGSDEALLQWIRFRQDRAGLYEAEVALSTPPAAKAGEAVRAVQRDPASTLCASFTNRWPDDARGRAVAAAWNRLSAKLDRLNEALGRSTVQRQTMGRGRPGGPLSDELVRLAYPLHPGQRWAISEGFRSEVVGRDQLVLPAGRFAAWKIRIESDYFSPDDEVHIWFGRQGELALEADLSQVATDENGEEIGTLHAQDVEFLTGLDLAQPGRTR